MLQDIAILTGGPASSKTSASTSRRSTSSTSARARSRARRQRRTTIVEGAGNAADISARAKQIRREIENTTSRLRPREAPGAPRQADRRHRRDPRRRRHRDRHEGAQGARRGRAPRDPRRDRGGHPPRRRHRAARALKALDKLALEGDGEQFGVDLMKRLARPRSARSRRTPASTAPSSLATWRLEAKGVVRLQRAERRVRRHARVRRRRPDQGHPSALTERVSVATLLLTTDAIVTSMPEDDEGHHDDEACGMGDPVQLRRRREQTEIQE
jgi:chaperonin GroEL